MAARNGDSPADMLEGKALLDRARALSNRPEDEIARGCGYVGPSGRVLKKVFIELWWLPRATRYQTALAEPPAAAKARVDKLISAPGCMATATC